MAVPALVAFSLAILCLPVHRTVADAPADSGQSEEYEPYDLEDAYGDPMRMSDDLLEDFGYGTDSLEGYAGYGEDSLFYYSDEFDEYYNKYGIYADEYGYDYFERDSDDDTDCKQDKDGKVTTKSAVCDIDLSGIDKHLTKDLPGGIDGLYKVDGCFEGLPKYTRAGKSENDTRVLWKSAVFHDWDISVGELNLAKAVVYGIGSGLEDRPNFLEEGHWRLSSSVAKEDPEEGAEVVKVNVTVQCTGDKKQLAKPSVSKSKGVAQPLLTDEETEANYRAVYARYQREPEPSVNFVMVILMVLLGAGVVVGIPRLLKRKQPDGRSLAQVLEDARKQRQGHTL